MVDDGDGVGTDQALAGEANGREQVRFAPQDGLHQVGDALGVGIGGEDIALGAQFAAQGFVIFDDAVVHDGNAARYVRVGIAFAGNAMRGPAGVGDAGDRLGSLPRRFPARLRDRPSGRARCHPAQ